MYMAEKLEIWGVKVDESCYHHLKIVDEFAGSSKNSEHRKAKESVDELIENDCKTALRLIVEQYAGSSRNKKSRLADKAHDAL